MATTAMAGVGAGNYARHGLVDAPTASLLAGVGACTAAVGARAAGRFGGSRYAGLFRPAFGAILLALAPGIITKKSMGADKDTRARIRTLQEAVDKAGLFQFTKRQFGNFSLDPAKHPGLLVSGGVGGFTQGFAAFGGGLIQTYYMANFMSPDLIQHQIIGTSLAASAIVNTLAARIYIVSRHVHFPTAAALGGVGAASLVMCTSVTLDVSEAKMRQVFGAFLLVSSGLMLKRGLPDVVKVARGARLGGAREGAGKKR